MATCQSIESSVPARLDRMPWSRWHWLIVISLGATWILDVSKSRSPDRHRHGIEHGIVCRISPGRDADASWRTGRGVARRPGRAAIARAYRAAALQPGIVAAICGVELFWRS